MVVVSNIRLHNFIIDTDESIQILKMITFADNETVRHIDKD